MADTKIESWDLFISYASEDKTAFVAPLASALSAFGVNVWYDDYELKPGDSLSRSIDAGLAKSNYGVVVLSPSFISKRWTEYELRGLTSREMLEGGKVILPIWHNVGLKDIVAFSPTLADKVAVKTESKTPVQIAVQIIDTIRPDIFTQIQRRLAYEISRLSAQTETLSVKSIRPAPIRHETLSEELVGRIRLVRASLLGAYTHSMDFWMDGFKRDAHPSAEVSYWERIAAVYREYTSMATVTLTREQHEAVFRFILALSSVPDEKLLDRLVAELPEEAPEILLNLYQYPEPMYDIEEELPHATESISPETLQIFATMDKERFPHDLPEELIRQLLNPDDLPEELIRQLARDSE